MNPVKCLGGGGAGAGSTVFQDFINPVPFEPVLPFLPQRFKILYQNFRQTFFAVRTPLPGITAPIFHLRQLVIVKEPVIREYIAVFRMPRIIETNTPSICYHPLDFLSDYLRGVGQGYEIAVTLAHLPVIQTQQLGRFSQ
jgi:hypothetical protein